ncbi:MAG: phosphoadenylyl-sulfate reductase [Deltaproteobacteria bacterium]|nr:phosphoadenylyl-sulfate reductase [Deltaproteobacteria bacterium]
MTSLAAENEALERKSPRERLAWAVERFGDRLLFTSSFGAGSGVLLHLWSEVARELPVIFLDTGFLFDETLAYRDRLAEQLRLNVQVVRPGTSREEFLREHGSNVYEFNPDLCCQHNKVDPLAPHLARAAAWVSGLRRDQSAARSSTPILLPTVRDPAEPGPAEGPVKVHPLATMTGAEANAYLRDHGIPEHPLVARRYLSIGCAPCTRPVEDGEDERAGRWAGKGKTECGIHTALRPRG